MRHISKSFPGVKALDDVGFSVAEGEVRALVGENGAGKSTLMKILNGNYKKDEGQILIDGVDVSKMPEHKRARYIGRVFQDPMMGTAAGMMIEENLAIASRRGKTPGLSWALKDSDRAKFREMLKELDLGLEDRLTSRVGLLSGGQRQALTLLMATLVTPKLLLLDEHTAALDPATAEKVLALTKSIVAEKKITCLMVTHNMHQALELGNRTLMMDAGRIVFDVKGAARSKMTVDDLLEKFRENAGKNLDNDRILLSKVEK